MGRRLEPAVSRARRAVRDSLCDGGPAPDHTLVLVGLSGGADSLALSAAAAFVAPRLGLRWGAVVVDHALQPGSGAVAATAAAQAARLGADPVRLVRVDVVDPSGAGAEAAARVARYDALAAAAADSGATAVLVAHTRDDQAETVLIGLARGSGARSLAGMRGASDLLPVPLLRPFLDLTRADTVAVCAAEHLTPWSDPHNADRAHLRSRVRADVLPVLEQHLGPGVRDALARTARLLGDDADLLDALAARLYDVARARDAAGDPAGVVLRVDALAGAPRALRRRALRLAALAAGAPGTDLGSVHVEAVDRLVTRWHGQRALDLPGRVVVRRTGDSVRFTRPV